jgi:phage head maturation protease
LVSATSWCNEDKAELTGYLVAFDSLRQELVDAQINKERVQKIAFDSSSERIADVETLFPSDSPSLGAEEGVQHPSTSSGSNLDEPVSPSTSSHQRC